MLKSLYSKAIVSCVTLLAISFVLSPFVGMARAEDQAQPAAEKPSFTFTTDFLSQYIFRGVALSRDSMVIEPSFTAAYKGFSVNVWGNADTHEAPNLSGSKDAASWTETDLTLSYAHTIWGNLSGTVGYIYYGTNYAPDTMEFTFGLSYALPWDITAALNAYRGFTHTPGWWAEFDLSKNFKLPWYGMNVDTALSLGYLDRSFNSALVHNDQLEAGQISAALNVPFCKYFTVSPKIGFSFPLSDAGSKDLIANSVDGQDTHIIGGVRIGAVF